MNRRTFVGRCLLGGAAVGWMSNASADEKAPNPAAASPSFRLKYAPALGRFENLAGTDLLDQIRFMHDRGFRAFFDNSLMTRQRKLQEQIAALAVEKDMKIGPFVGLADFKNLNFVLPGRSIRSQLLKKMEEALETAQRTQVQWVLVVPGRCDESLEWDYQTANVIENLRCCAEVFEPHGVVMVIEPLNAVNHPGLFLTRIPQAAMICRAVNSPSCKIVNDLYHQQITEGSLIHNIDTAWDQIAAFHIGDVPGRMEPTTGEINYKNIFKHLHEKRYNGVLCMEHGISQEGAEGEERLIEAYRQCDSF